MDSPAPDERIAVFEMSELPGRASMIDWAFFLGSSVGSLEAWRDDMVGVRAGSVLIETEGRSLAVPEYFKPDWYYGMK